jgi:hypothetical protein
MLQNFIFPQIILTLDGSAFVASSIDNVVPLSVTAAPAAITDAPTPLSSLPKRCEVPVESNDLGHFDVPDLNESVNKSHGYISCQRIDRVGPRVFWDSCRQQASKCAAKNSVLDISLDCNLRKVICSVF